MKKIITFITLAIIITFQNGCSDYLDVKPRGYDVPHKLAHYEGLIYGGEFSFLPVYFYETFEHTVDEAGFAELYDKEGHNAAQAFLWKDSIFRSEDECSEWNAPCSRFYTLNLIIDEVMDAEDGTDTQKRAVQAEARFLRAWYTYMMAQYFGKPYNTATASTDLCVPIIKKASTVGTDFTRRTVEEVYQYIITEMTESLHQLPERSAHVNRVFHSTGNAMLGKVYWMMGNYDEGLPYLKTAKENLEKDRELLDFGSIINESWGEIDDYPNYAYNPETVYLIQNIPNLFTVMGPMTGTPIRTLKKDVMQHYFEEGDYRLALYTGVENFETAYANFDPEVRYYTNLTNISSNEGISMPDVYLMYAECLARENHLPEARQIITELRQNRMPSDIAQIPANVTSKDQLIKFIIAERVRENFGTGIIWYDMRRLWNDPLFQDLKQYYTRTIGKDTFTLTEARLTMLIPPTVMSWHPEYQQNE